MLWSHLNICISGAISHNNTDPLKLLTFSTAPHKGWLLTLYRVVEPPMRDGEYTILKNVMVYHSYLCQIVLCPLST